ncbi:MAG: hypothetical protein LBM98_03080 [Oscillospiraceae bacterium]|nr:hypothetical protein [Oscillospiraceae bacterium]
MKVSSTFTKGGGVLRGGAPKTLVATSGSPASHVPMLTARPAGRKTPRTQYQRPTRSPREPKPRSP